MRNKYITSGYGFEKICNNEGSTEWMLTTMAGAPHPFIDWAVIEAIICLMRKKRVKDLDQLLSISLELKDVKSFNFNQPVTNISLLAQLINDDIAYGSIEETDDNVVFIKDSPTKFSLFILTDEAGDASKIVDRLIDGDTELSAEFRLTQQNMEEVPNIFDAYPELEF